MDRVTSWVERSGYRWAAMHDGRQQVGWADTAFGAHARAMKWVFEQRKKS